MTITVNYNHNASSVAQSIIGGLDGHEKDKPLNIKILNTPCELVTEVFLSRVKEHTKPRLLAKDFKKVTIELQSNYKISGIPYFTEPLTVTIMPTGKDRYHLPQTISCPFKPR